MTPSAPPPPPRRSHAARRPSPIRRPTRGTDDSKAYDREYYHRWYHDPRTRVSSAESIERKVHLAVSVAEFLLGRRIRTVLDVGCGEAPWLPVLRRLRRGLRYVGVDPSEYVVRRYGRTRHVRLGSLGGLADLGLSPGFDLVVCADTIQYVPTPDLSRGLREIRRLLSGVAYLEAYAREDDMEGDMEGWIDRSADELLAIFRRAGLAHLGLNCFHDPRAGLAVNALERGQP